MCSAGIETRGRCGRVLGKTYGTLKLNRSGKPYEAEVMEARRSSPWLWPVLAILVVVGVVALLAVVMSPYGGGYYGMMGGGWGWGIAMVAMMLVPLVVLVLLVLVFAGTLSPRGVPLAYVPETTPPMPAGSALEILDARYARGESSQDEDLRIKSGLAGGGGNSPSRDP